MGRQLSFAPRAMCSYPVRPGLGCWLFWESHLPAETPLDIVQPSQAGNGHAKASQQTQKVPPPSPQGAEPHHSAFGGSLGVSRLCPAPIISHLLSGNKQSMGTGIFLAGRKAWLQNGACSSLTERCGGWLHGLERVKWPKASQAKKMVHRTQPCTSPNANAKIQPQSDRDFLKMFKPSVTINKIFRCSLFCWFFFFFLFSQD